jgi:hypothetical protein
MREHYGMAGKNDSRLTLGESVEGKLEPFWKVSSNTTIEQEEDGESLLEWSKLRQYPPTGR